MVRKAVLIWVVLFALMSHGVFASDGAGIQPILVNDYDFDSDVSRPLPMNSGLPGTAIPATAEELPAPAAGTQGPGEITAPAAILMDVLTGTVLFDKNADEPRPPASITKIMTLLLAYEAIENGYAHLDDLVEISRRAQDMGGTQAFLAEGQAFPLDDLLKAIVVASANDASVAVAEHLAGSVEAFAELMNQKARELGMENSHFVNPHGLHDPDHYMSARDVAIVSRELLRRFPQVLEYASIWTYTFPVAENCCLLTNTNRMIRKYRDVDGLKTGWTSQAGYGVSATAARDDTRFVAVVMGHNDPNVRFEEAARLLNWGFAGWESLFVVSGGEVVREVPVYEGEQRRLALVAAGDFGVLLPKGGGQPVTHVLDVPEQLTAPVEKGEVLGALAVFQDDKEIGRVDLVADRTVQRLSLWSLWWRIWTGLQGEITGGY